MLSSGKQKAALACIFILIIIFFIPSPAKAQKWEIGAGAGGGNYVGDINPSFRFENFQPAGGIFGRYNFSHAVSAKLAVNLVKTHGSDKYNNDPHAKIRNDNFIRVLGEAVGQIEYNFFNYRDEKSRRNWTPYFFIGAGAFYMDGFTAPARKIQPVIPGGVGFRKILRRKWNIGFEFGARKTFTDFFEPLNGTPSADPKFGKEGNKYDRDWYFVSTISVSYTFYSIPCPFGFD